MVSGRSQAFSLLLSIGILVFSWTLQAEEIKCPVCHQSFSVDTEVCPNDGTDLKLRGVPIPSSAEAVRKESSVAPSDEAKGAEDVPKGKSGASKYKRRAAKRRSLQQKKPSSRGYSDRRSRIDGERGTAEAERRNRQREKEAFEKEDVLLTNAFEERRAGLWEAKPKPTSEGTAGLEGSVGIQKRLISSPSAPLTSLGFRMFWMGEGNDSGPVGSGEIEVNLARYWFRGGLSTLFGTRSVQERSDFLFLSHLSAGFQWPNRFSPFLVARGGLGLLSISSNQNHLLGSVGFDGGVDSWITPKIAISVSVGYKRLITEEAHWDSVSYRISVGF